MKKYFYLSAAALATLFATSCSSDDVPAPVDGDLTTFQVQLPEELATRFGEGTTATNLYVAIYKQGQTDAAPLFTNFGGATSTDLKIEPVASTGAGKWTVSVPLVKNMHYDIVFWSQAPNAPFEFAPNTKTITVNYTGMTNFQEARDAFFGQLEDFTSTGAVNDNVTLTRPFSQINIGTADYSKYIAASGVTAPTFAMSVSGINNTLNLLSGEVGLDETKLTEGQTLLTATSTLTAKNADDLTANNTNYSYLGMAYVLAGGVDSQLTVDVNLYVNTLAGKFASYDNVPVQMNYRTNIYGDLLTNTETFNVEILPDFEKSDINQLIPGDGEILMNGQKYDSLQGAITAAGATESKSAEIALGAGTWNASEIGAASNKLINLSITGVGDATVIQLNGAVQPQNTNLVFKKIKLVTPNKGYIGFQHTTSATYEYCTIQNLLFLYGGTETFTHCKFINDNEYNVWTYGCKNATFKDCSFGEYGKGILIYIEGGIYATINVNGCTFNGTTVDGKAAIEIDGTFPSGGEGLYTVNIDSCTVTGYSNNTISKSNIWNVKNGDNAKVTLDGVVVFPQP